MQAAAQKGHVVARRDDVGTIGLHDHAVLNLEDLHPGVTANEIGEDTLVIGRQVLHQNEGHAGIDIGGHAGEEGLEGGKAAG